MNNMKSLEEYLREAFTEIEIDKDNSIYPNSVQRPKIYTAMKAAISEACREQREICADQFDKTVDSHNHMKCLNAPEPKII